MDHSTAKTVLMRAIDKGRAVHMWGPPGIGKTSIVREIADELKLDLIDIRASQLDPSDVRGIPMPEDGKTKWLVPSWLPTEGKGILFLDEFNLAPPLVQSSFYQLILDRKLGDYILPEKWTVICAGNRIEDRSNVFEMSWALANRFMHIYLDVPAADEWVRWAAKHHIDERIVSFLHFRNELLFKFDVRAKSKAYPTPRTWEFLSSLIEGDSNLNSIKEIATCVVGEGVAAEIVGFVKLVKNVDVPKLLAGKDKIPEAIDLRYALVSAVSNYYKKHKEAETLKQIFKLSERLEPEFKFLLLRLVATSDAKFFLQHGPKMPEFEKVKDLADFM